MKAAILLFGAALLAIPGTLLAGSRAVATTTREVVPFDKAQAVAGSKVFAASCASCHGAELEGGRGPALGGSTSAIADQSVSSVYGFMTKYMPQSAPGSLSAREYVVLTAFLLESNGRKPGKSLLDAAEAGKSTETFASGG